MKKNLNLKSRTVWIGIIGFTVSVGFGIWGIYNPAIRLSVPVDILVTNGLISLLGIFIKS